MTTTGHEFYFYFFNQGKRLVIFINKEEVRDGRFISRKTAENLNNTHTDCHETRSSRGHTTTTQAAHKHTTEARVVFEIALSCHRHHSATTPTSSENHQGDHHRNRVETLMPNR